MSQYVFLFPLSGSLHPSRAAILTEKTRIQPPKARLLICRIIGNLKIQTDGFGVNRGLVLALPLVRLELDPLTLYLLGEHYELSTAGGCMESGFPPLALAALRRWSSPLTACCRHSPVPRPNSR